MTSSAATSVSLNGKWRIRQIGGAHKLTGTVPGVVHHDLIRKKIVGEPFFRMNEADQQWVGDATWEYSRSFRLTKTQCSRSSVVLNCDGIDTNADIYINGHKAGTTDNMFLGYRFDIAKKVRPGSNAIRILFHPANALMEERAGKYPLSLRGYKQVPWQTPTIPFLRKCQCHNGWDWGPRFMTQGIYRDISVECHNGQKILYVTHLQSHKKKAVDVTVRAIIESPGTCNAKVTFALGKSRETREIFLSPGENTVSSTLRVEDPRLWWPNGMGNASLYKLSVTVASAGESDTTEQYIGLRTVEVVRDADDYGETFYFRVNGVPLFCKGSNWIPSDSFDSRLTDDQIARELGSAAAGNQNMVRVWGGGLYERGFFYQTCDRLGLLVWQDFMFACAHYPANPEFLDSVRHEVRHQIRRLMHHPCIALWCGNNENEGMVSDWHLKNKPNGKALREAYDKLYIQVMMPIVEEEDPGRLYWPCSPSSGVRQYHSPGELHRGDTHYWAVWHGNEACGGYQKTKLRFCSEFGWQSFSSPETMATVTLPKDRNLTSPVFEFHQRSRGEGKGNGKILAFMARHFRFPSGYENTIYVSQAQQALYLKVAVEHWRRCRPLTMGALIWQLNDIWPVASWATLEYDGRWKMAHYASRKFFAPLLVSVREENDRVEIWGSSDENRALDCSLRVELLGISGHKFLSRTGQIRLRALSSRKILSLRRKDLCPDEASRGTKFLRLSLSCGKLVSTNEHFFAEFKGLALTKPRIATRLSNRNGRILLSLTSDTLAPFVWIRHGNIQGVWSDNGMHLLPGRTVHLTFTPRGDVSLAELRRSLILHNLYDAA